MKLVGTGALLIALLLAAASPSLAAPGDGSFLDNLSLGSGLILYNRDRIYHATTRCREVDFHHCGDTSEGEPADRVIVTRQTPVSAQLLLDYHPFGRPVSDSSLLSADRVSAQLVTSYGLEAEDKKILEGAGLGYTLASLDAFDRPKAITLIAGGVWLTDVHMLRSDDHPGHLEHGQSPTEHAPMLRGMLTLSIGL